jgi:hypothetical protein
VVEFTHVKKLKCELFAQTEAIEIHVFAASAVTVATEHMVLVLILM